MAKRHLTTVLVHHGVPTRLLRLEDVPRRWMRRKNLFLRCVGEHQCAPFTLTTHTIADRPLVVARVNPLSLTSSSFSSSCRRGRTVLPERPSADSISSSVAPQGPWASMYLKISSRWVEAAGAEALWAALVVERTVIWLWLCALRCGG